MGSGSSPGGNYWLWSWGVIKEERGGGRYPKLVGRSWGVPRTKRKNGGGGKECWQNGLLNDPVREN